METYFEGIKEILIQEIEKAEFIIYVAVAWITDYDIISTLSKKLLSGVQIEIVVNGDKQFSKVKSKFNEFLLHGGRLSLYENLDRSIMHNKFCVIDLSTTLTGSFNWSFSASAYHKENIIIERDNLIFARQFAREFSKLKKASVTFDRKYIPYDSAFYANAEVADVCIEENSELYCRVEVTDNHSNKLGILFIYCEPGLIPDTIFGVWTAHEIWQSVSIENPVWHEEPAFVHGKPVYGFDCLDSRLSYYKVK